MKKTLTGAVLLVVAAAIWFGTTDETPTINMTPAVLKYGSVKNHQNSTSGSGMVEAVFIITAE
ncbi:MAG: hypothetical protein M3Q80_02835 [bacterium]|nr:hypothetical protein [bacterium]